MKRETHLGFLHVADDEEKGVVGVPGDAKKGLIDLGGAVCTSAHVRRVMLGTAHRGDRFGEGMPDVGNPMRR